MIATERRNIRRTTLFPLILLLVLSDAYGQLDTTTSTDVEQQLWVDFSPRFQLGLNLDLTTELGFRTNLFDQDFRRIYFRPGLRYNLSPIVEIYGGIGFFYNNYNLSVDHFEIRPWQGIKVGWPTINRLSVRNYVRLEERFSYLKGFESLDYSTRLRYQLSLRYDFAEKPNGHFWYIHTHGELFVPFSSEIKELYRNRGRIGLGIGHQLSRAWRLNLVAIWQKSRSGPDDQLEVSDFICRLRINKSFSSKKEDFD